MFSNNNSNSQSSKNDKNYLIEKSDSNGNISIEIDSACKLLINLKKIRQRNQNKTKDNMSSLFEKQQKIANLLQRTRHSSQNQVDNIYLNRKFAKRRCSENNYLYQSGNFKTTYAKYFNGHSPRCQCSHNCSANSPKCCRTPSFDSVPRNHSSDMHHASKCRSWTEVSSGCEDEQEESIKKGYEINIRHRYSDTDHEYY